MPGSSQVRLILVGTMVATLYLQVEVVGCPTVCRHCWAQGVPYPAMPVDDVAWVLEQTHRFCDDHGLEFGAYPMHELAAHPQAPELLRLFAGQVGAAEFEPLATTGVPLAVRQDWQQVLAAAATLGTTTIWVAFHGLGVEHDRQVNRPGAFAETCLAIQRAHAVGLRAGCNVFLTTANVGQAQRLLGALQRLEVDQVWGGRRPTTPRRGAAATSGSARRCRSWCRWPTGSAPSAPSTTTSGRTWRPTPRRPGRAARWPVTGRPGPATPVRCWSWCAAPTWTCTPAPPAGTGNGTATCAPTARRAALADALKQGGWSYEALWFGPDPLPSVAELAARHGDSDGPGVHFSADSVRSLWLDRAQPARPATTLGSPPWPTPPPR
jgi:hypothetical protein